ncbi:hypothetical protein HMPREF1556_00865 [Porphyromonas sp. oral taxon 278 str. W7784]|nr:hypothetical protein HMPREF1556_00865 [Porphyromonas sp. oral taxon 278 str. W7784]
MPILPSTPLDHRGVLCSQSLTSQDDLPLSAIPASVTLASLSQSLRL